MVYCEKCESAKDFPKAELGGFRIQTSAPWMFFSEMLQGAIEFHYSVAKKTHGRSLRPLTSMGL